MNTFGEVVNSCAKKILRKKLQKGNVFCFPRNEINEEKEMFGGNICKFNKREKIDTQIKTLVMFF